MMADDPPDMTGTEPLAQRAALCIGKFDALHRGHRSLVEAARQFGPPGLLSFTGMAEVLGWPPRQPLVAPSERAGVLRAWDCAEVFLPFTQVQPLDAAAFIALVRNRFDPVALVVGDDFRGGRGRSTDADTLAAVARDQGLPLIIVPRLSDSVGPISSSRIRERLTAGDVAGLAALSGRPHRLVGTVARGDGRGRQLGFPTANCAKRENAEPAQGVYAAWAEVLGQRLPAAVNVGRLPSVAPDRPLTVEAHLLDWTGDCYGQRLVLEFVERIRAEQRFPDLAALAAQIRQDVTLAGNILDV